ncbi:uncharacterized protein N7477_005523 [Penicillium maclennaniae]|uniref:uncharacterized protein n=1 Tax=Penicillium maclennaniae TaxID=1343394 RepID=UPI0025410966|nr:uncharacterized protein N7477_005523 [Penicillium maclennaniae]KAJ5670160.1 hypothetical protein N7477_005523 [Penicillium maclennaniae]
MLPDILRSRSRVPCYLLGIVLEILLGRRLSRKVRRQGIIVLILLPNSRLRILAGYSVKLTAILILYAYMYLENKRRDREALGRQESEQDGIENGMLDQTEIDNKEFRYRSNTSFCKLRLLCSGIKRSPCPFDLFSLPYLRFNSSILHSSPPPCSSSRPYRRLRLGFQPDAAPLPFYQRCRSIRRRACNTSCLEQSPWGDLGHSGIVAISHRSCYFPLN